MGGAGEIPQLPEYPVVPDDIDPARPAITFAQNPAHQVVIDRQGRREALRFREHVGEFIPFVPAVAVSMRFQP